MNVDGCSFRVGDKRRNGRLSVRSRFPETFGLAASRELRTNGSAAARRKSKQPVHEEPADVQWRRELFLNIWETIEQEVAQCTERVFDGVLKDLVAFVHEASSSSEHNGFGNLSAATVQFGASDDDKFFADLDIRLQARYPVVRLRAETCKTAHKCTQQIINSFFTNIKHEDADVQCSQITTMRRFVEWLENNPSCDTPSPTKKHKKERTLVVEGTPRALVVVFENLEAFDRQVIDELVVVLGDYAHKLRFVLVFGVATEARIVHSLLSHDAYKLLALRTFRFPSPKVFLNKVIENTVFNDKIMFKFHPKMVYLFVGRFEQENFSMAELTKSMKLALLDHFLRQPMSAICCQEPMAQERLCHADTLSSIRALDSVAQSKHINAAPASQIAKKLLEPLNELFVYVRCYKPVLGVLFSLLQRLPDGCFAQINEHIMRLHIAVMTANGDFFDIKRDNFYAKATALWASWTVEEWKDELRECLGILRSTDPEALPDVSDFSQALNKFIRDLDNIAERQKIADEELMGAQHDEYVGKSPSTSVAQKRMAEKQSFIEMQRKSRLRRDVATKSNVFARDKKDIIEYLTKMFKSHLRSPETVPMHECFFAAPSEAFRSRSMAAPNKCLDQTLLCPDKVFGNCEQREQNRQRDIAVVFQSFQKLASEAKAVSVLSWLSTFTKMAELQTLDEEDQLVRFYKCVGELELIGCLKAASERNLMSAHKLYWTSEVMGGFG